MSIHIDDRPAVRAGENQRATDFSELRSHAAPLLDRSNEFVATAASTQPQSNFSTREREKGRSAADVVAVRLLAALVVALIVTSIVGLTVVDDHANPTAPVVAGVIGMSSAVLGLLFGFMKAYQSS